MTAGIRCGCNEFTKCGKLLYGQGFPLRLNGAVYNIYVRPAILYGNESWCLKECKMGILRRGKRSMVSTMCGVQF